MLQLFSSQLRQWLPPFVSHLFCTCSFAHSKPCCCLILCEDHDTGVSSR